MGTAALIATIVVILFLIFCLIHGYRKGFLKIVLTTLALVVTIVAASLLTPTFTKWIKTTFIGTSVQKSVTEFIDKKIDDSAAAFIDSVGAAQDKVIDALPLPKFIKEDIAEKNTSAQYRTLGVKTFKEYLSVRISDALIKAISFIILMILIYIVIRIVLKIVGVIGKVPVIRGINRLLGAVLCLLEGAIAIYVVCILVTAISGTPFGQSVIGVINESAFLKFFYNNNLLLVVVKSVFKIG